MIKQLEASGKKSFDDFGLLIATRNISPPKKKSIKENVPFSNKVYDFSKINGEIYWEERTLEYSFDIAEISTEEMEVVKTNAMNWLMNIHDEDIYDPYIGDYHFHGSYKDNSWSEDFGAGTINVTFEVYPYKISNTSNEAMELLEGELTIDTPATIENTSYSQMKGLTIDGASYQKQTEQGSNIFAMTDKTFYNKGSDITSYEIEGYNKITLQGIGGHAYNSIIFTIPSELLEEGTEYFLGGMVERFTSPSEYALFNINEIDIETGERTNYIEKSIFQNQLNTNITMSLSIQDLSKYRYDIRLYTTTNVAGTSEDTTELVFKNLYVSKVNQYTPFIPDSPSPDYTSEINTLDGIKNLIKIEDTEETTVNGVKVSVKDNLITLNGTATVEGAFDLANAIFDFVKDGKYRISIKYVSGNWSVGYLGIRRQKPTTVFYLQENYNHNFGGSSQIVTLDNYGDGSNIYLYCTGTSVFDNFKCYIQVEEGSVAHSYVPYGKQYLRVDTFSGNHLLNINKYGWNENDATLEVIDNYLKINMPLSPKRWSGVYCKNYGDDGLAMVDLLRKLKGKTCTYSFYARADKERTIYFQFGDTEVTYITLTTEWKRYSRTMVIGTQVPTFYCGTTYDTTTYYIKDIMLEEGDTLNKYREYGADAILIDMTDNELVSIGNIKDELIIDGSTTKIIKNIGKVILNGSEGWIKAGTYNNEGYRYYFTQSDVKPNTANDNIPNLVCDTFKAVTPTNTWYKVKGITVLRDNKHIAICFESAETETLDLFKTWLSENPVTVYYELETPIEIELTTTELPYIFNDVTIVTINDELNTTIDISYTEKKTLIINNNSSHRINPTIISEGNFTISLNGISYAVGEGTYNNSIFYLESGVNEVVVTGTGRIAFRYVEEVF